MESGVIIPDPQKEIARIQQLWELDINFAELRNEYSAFTELAAKIAGAEICQINLIDSFTQWTLSSYGMDLHQIPREQSICQYTILKDVPLEIQDLTKELKFGKLQSLTYPPHIKYYLGIPLVTKDGWNLGALCVLDSGIKNMEAEKVGMLQIVANKVVEQLEIKRSKQQIQNALYKEYDLKRQLNHDIRGPIGGIIGLIQLIKDHEPDNKVSEISQFIDLIETASNKMLTLAAKKLSESDKEMEDKAVIESYNLEKLKTGLQFLFGLQAKACDIDLTIANHPTGEDIAFPKTNMMKVACSLISNMIQITPAGGMIMVRQEFNCASKKNTVRFTVKNTATDGRLDRDFLKRILKEKYVPKLQEYNKYKRELSIYSMHLMLEKIEAEIQISLEEDKAVCFDVTVPVRRM